MPTLYDNFSQVKQYIDQEKPDLTSYVTKTELAGMSYVTSYTLNSYLTVPPSIVPNPTVPYTLYRYGISSNDQWHFIYPNAISYTNAVSTDGNAWASVGTVRNYVDGRLVEIESSYATTTYVADYVAEHGGGGGSEVTYAYLSENYVAKAGDEMSGYLYISYNAPGNADYSLNTYSHIVAGNAEKTTPSFIASKRNCKNGTQGNMASFFVNSDGRAKFAHKTAVNGGILGLGGDDAFMCFNAYGFKVAYSGTEGTSATTEYEILHEGNIGNLGYATQTYVADYVAEHGGGGSTVINESIIPKETGTYTLGDSSYKYYTVYSENFMTRNKCSVHSTSDYNIHLKVNNADRWTFDTLNLVPNSNGDHILGSSTYLFAATYTSQVNVGNNSKMYNDNGGITFSINSNNGVRIGSSAIYPKTSGGFSLGSSSNKWYDTYTYNLYAPTAYSTYIVGPQGHINLNGDTQAPFILSYDVSGTTTKLMQLAYRYAGDNYKGWKFAPLVNEDINLGSYNSHGVTQWGSTYTKSLYLDGTPIQSIINSLFSYDTATGTLTITTL